MVMMTRGNVIEYAIKDDMEKLNYLNHILVESKE